MNRISHFIILLVACIALGACEKRPKDIIAKGEMTDVLYDYHLAQAIIGQEGNGKDGEYQKLLDVVLSKHQITQAQFDSSIVWYNVHADDLEDIYKELEKRFNARAEEKKLTTGENEMTAIITENGDTTNLWNGPKVILLRAQDLLSVEKFTYKADTSFRNNDKFLLVAQATFLGTQDIYEHHNVTATLAIHDKKGMTFSDVKTYGNNTNIHLEISSAEGNPLRSVSGSFYFQNEQSSKTICIISQIQLIRMRIRTEKNTLDTLQNETKVEKKDSIVSDSPVMKKHGERKSPEQIRKEQTDNKSHFKIRTAPEVRRTDNQRHMMRRRKISQ